MSIELRKISNTRGKSNKGSFTLNLPKEWCEENNVIHGDELQLHLDRIAPGTVLIQLPDIQLNSPKKELIIDDTNLKSAQARRRAILGGYLEGYETIKLDRVSRKSSERLRIREDLHELTFKLDGASTNEERRTFEITIRSIDRSPVELLEKLYDTTKAMLEDIFKAYLDLDQLLSKDLIQRENQSDKLYFSIVRSLKLVLREPFKFTSDSFQLEDTLDFRMVASALENLCDATEAVAQIIAGYENSSDTVEVKPLEGDHRKQFRAIADNLLEVLAEAYQCYKDNDEDLAVEMSSNKPLMKEYKDQLSDMEVHPTLLNVLEETSETIVDLLELVHAEPNQG